MSNRDEAFTSIRSNLNYVMRKKDEYKTELTSLGKEEYGFFLVKIATECVLLLDQIMEVVCEKISDIDKKKLRIYFPCDESEDKLKKGLKSMGLKK